MIRPTSASAVTRSLATSTRAMARMAVAPGRCQTIDHSEPAEVSMGNTARTIEVQHRANVNRSMGVRQDPPPADGPDDDDGADDHRSQQHRCNRIAEPRCSRVGRGHGDAEQVSPEDVAGGHVPQVAHRHGALQITRR